MNREALIRDFEAYMTGNKLSEATIYTYFQAVTEFLTTLGKPPQRTTKRDIESFKTHLADWVGQEASSSHYLPSATTSNPTTTTSAGR